MLNHLNYLRPVCLKNLVIAKYNIKEEDLLSCKFGTFDINIGLVLRIAVHISKFPSYCSVSAIPVINNACPLPINCCRNHATGRALPCSTGCRLIFGCSRPSMRQFAFHGSWNVWFSSYIPQGINQDTDSYSQRVPSPVSRNNTPP